MALTAEHLIVIGRGRLVADTSVEEFVRGASKKLVRVRTPQAAQLRELVLGPDVTVESRERGTLEITGLTAQQIGEAAAAEGFVLYELTPIQASLEEAFMDLTRDTVEFGIRRRSRSSKRRSWYERRDRASSDSCDPTPRVRFGVDQASLGSLDAIRASGGGRLDDRPGGDRLRRDREPLGGDARRGAGELQPS